MGAIVYDVSDAYVESTLSRRLIVVSKRGSSYN